VSQRLLGRSDEIPIELVTADKEPGDTDEDRKKDREPLPRFH